MSGGADEGRGTVSIHIRIVPEAADKLDSIAKAIGGSRSEAVALAVRRLEVIYEERMTMVPVVVSA